MFGLTHRDELPQGAVSDEFESLAARLAAFLLVEHSEDGTHNVRPSGFDFVPIGGMIMWGTATAPDGWRLCNGDNISRATFQALFALIGTTYGVGDGSTTFTLPDLRQRFPLGRSGAGTGNALGATGGTVDHTHTGPSHTHTGPSHTHSFGATTSADGTHDHGAATGAESAHTHSVAAGTTGEPSASQTVDNELAGSTVEVASGGHTHANGAAQTSGAGSSHAHGIGTDGSHTHTVAGTTGAEGTGNTGASGTGATSTANPPFQVVNFIICTGVGS